MGFQDAEDSEATALREFPGRVDTVGRRDGLLKITFEDGETHRGVSPDDPDLRLMTASERAAERPRRRRTKAPESSSVSG